MTSFSVVPLQLLSDEVGSVQQPVTQHQSASQSSVFWTPPPERFSVLFICGDYTGNHVLRENIDQQRSQLSSLCRALNASRLFSPYYAVMEEINLTHSSDQIESQINQLVNMKKSFDLIHVSTHGCHNGLHFRARVDPILYCVDVLERLPSMEGAVLLLACCDCDNVAKAAAAANKFFGVYGTSRELRAETAFAFATGLYQHITREWTMERHMHELQEPSLRVCLRKGLELGRSMCAVSEQHVWLLKANLEKLRSPFKLLISRLKRHYGSFRRDLFVPPSFVGGNTLEYLLRLHPVCLVQELHLSGLSFFGEWCGFVRHITDEHEDEDFKFSKQFDIVLSVTLAQIEIARLDLDELLGVVFCIPRKIRGDFARELRGYSSRVLWIVNASNTNSASSGDGSSTSLIQGRILAHLSDLNDNQSGDDDLSWIQHCIVLSKSPMVQFGQSISVDYSQGSTSESQERAAKGDEVENKNLKRQKLILPLWRPKFISRGKESTSSSVIDTKDVKLETVAKAKIDSDIASEKNSKVVGSEANNQIGPEVHVSFFNTSIHRVWNTISDSVDHRGDRNDALGGKPEEHAPTLQHSEEANDPLSLAWKAQMLFWKEPLAENFDVFQRYGKENPGPKSDKGLSYDRGIKSFVSVRLVVKSETFEFGSEISLSELMLERRHVFLRGESGCGKTALCKHLFNLWAKREILHEYQLVVFIHCKKLSSVFDMNVKSIVGCAKIRDAPLIRAIEERSLRVLFIFDSVSDVNTHWKQDFFTPMCRGEIDWITDFIVSGHPGDEIESEFDESEIVHVASEFDENGKIDYVNQYLGRDLLVERNRVKEFVKQSRTAGEDAGSGGGAFGNSSTFAEKMVCWTPLNLQLLCAGWPISSSSGKVLRHTELFENAIVAQLTGDRKFKIDGGSFEGTQQIRVWQECLVELAAQMLSNASDDFFPIEFFACARKWLNRLNLTAIWPESDEFLLDAGIFRFDKPFGFVNSCFKSYFAALHLSRVIAEKKSDARSVFRHAYEKNKMFFENGLTFKLLSEILLRSNDYTLLKFLSKWICECCSPHWIVGKDLALLVRVMMREGYLNVTSRDDANLPLLHRCSNVSVMKAILDSAPGTAIIDVTDENSWTRLHAACFGLEEDVVELLIQHGANVNAKTDDDDTPLLLALGGNQPISVTIVCRLYRYDMERIQRHGRQILLQALLKSNVFVVQYLLDAGIQVVMKIGESLNCEVDGENLLRTACRSCNAVLVEMVWKELTKFGWTGNERDELGQSAIHYAAQSGSVDIVLFVLQQMSSNPNFLDKNDTFAAHYVCEKGSLEALLLFDSLQLHGFTKTKKSCFHFAAKCQTENLNVFAYLLESANLNINEQDQYGKTPLDYACNSKNVEFIKCNGGVSGHQIKSPSNSNASLNQGDLKRAKNDLQ